MVHRDMVWVFGYGSLVWNPGFRYKDSVTGYVRGFSRKFWQGNVTHRGTVLKPGRVATLIEEKDGIVWGRAFLVEEGTALPYLESREVILGGYDCRTTAFYPQEGRDGPLQAVVYLATPDNHYWLGEAPEMEIAQQILTSCGPSGHNVEYLLRLAQFMREHIPGAQDEHLFKLEELVRSSGVIDNCPQHKVPMFTDRRHSTTLKT